MALLIEKEFPKIVTLTVTNSCNLRCKMCAQWSGEGYMLQQNKNSFDAATIPLDRLLKVVDEIKEYGAFLIIRGGEPLLYPHIRHLLEYIKLKKVPLSLETNGVFLNKYAELLVKIKIDNLTVSLDGPENIHDYVRGVDGTFVKIRDGIEEITKYEKSYGYKIHRGLACTISGYNYLGLSAMPDVMRSLGFDNICIIPYTFISQEQGLAYEKLMREQFACKAFSWRGFHHEESGVDIEQFLTQLGQFKSNLKSLELYPYMSFTNDEYREWYAKSNTTVHQTECNNINGLVDVQPDGNVNFCIDFPDYAIGNVLKSTLYKIWHSERARKFRETRSKGEMPICYRCSSKYLV
jgi:MoaA/NifB/PqqE/SkfB family radical SAM enzyme